LRQKETVVIRILGTGLLALIVIGTPTQAKPGIHRVATSVALAAPRLVQYECGVFGPYATMRRANEVANEARGYGFTAVAFHNGDGYYVRVC
jgi:hypothetical protein